VVGRPLLLNEASRRHCWCLGLSFRLASAEGRNLIGRVVRVGRQPVGDRRRPAWIGHVSDLREPMLVPAADAFELAETLVPRADDELLEYASWIGGVDP
jgi:hypothetical protein